MKLNFMILAVCFAYTAVFAQQREVFKHVNKQYDDCYIDKQMPVNAPSKEANMLIPGAFGMPCGTLPDNLNTYMDEFMNWITGSNEYGDSKFGYLFKGESGMVSSVKAYLRSAANDGADVENVFAELYSVNENGLPDELLGVSEPISSGDISRTVSEYTFTFSEFVEVPEDFFAVITIPTYTETSTDVVVATSPNNCFAAGTEKYSVAYVKDTGGGMGTEGWMTIFDSWEETFLFDLAIFPVLGYDAAISDKNLEQFVVQPNPTNGELQICGLNGANNPVRIYNIAGNVIETQCVVDRLDISHLPAGMYFVQANGQTLKVIKK